jgi:hypothetical protein
MKKIFLVLAVSSIGLMSCTEIIPEYIPFFEDKQIEERITLKENFVLKASANGTLWYTSPSNKKVFWIKDGVINSIPMYKHYPYDDYGDVLGNDFFILTSKELFRVNANTVKTYPLPNSDFDNAYWIKATSSNLILFANTSELGNRYWLFSDFGWIECNYTNSVPDDIFYNMKQYGHFNNKYILYRNQSSGPTYIYNFESKQLVTFEYEAHDQYNYTVNYSFGDQPLDANGNGYAIAGGKIAKFNFSTQQVEELIVSIPEIPNPILDKISVSSKGDIWVIFHDEELSRYLYKYGANSYTSFESPYTSFSNYYSNDIINMYADGSGKIWIYPFYPDMYETCSIHCYGTTGLFTEQPLENSWLYGGIFLEEDGMGNIWVYTVDNWNFGILRFNGSIWSDYSKYFYIHHYLNLY